MTDGEAVRGWIANNFRDDFDDFDDLEKLQAHFENIRSLASNRMEAKTIRGKNNRIRGFNEVLDKFIVGDEVDKLDARVSSEISADITKSNTPAEVNVIQVPALKPDTETNLNREKANRIFLLNNEFKDNARRQIRSAGTSSQLESVVVEREGGFDKQIISTLKTIKSRRLNLLNELDEAKAEITPLERRLRDETLEETEADELAKQIARVGRRIIEIERKIEREE